MSAWVRAVGWPMLGFAVYYLGVCGIGGLLLVVGVRDQPLAAQAMIALIIWGPGLLALLVGYLAAHRSRLGIGVSVAAGVLAAGWHLRSLQEPSVEASYTLIAAGEAALGFVIGGCAHQWLHRGRACVPAPR